MLKTLTLSEVQKIQTGGIAREDGEFFRLSSLAAVRDGCPDYMDTLIPRTLPVGQDGNVIIPGVFNETHSCELAYDLLGAELFLYTGKLIPADGKNQSPAFECRYPKDSEDVAVHAIRKHGDRYLGQSLGELNERFGAKYGATWHHCYKPSSGPKRWTEDVWILPINGPIKPLCDYLAVLFDHDVSEGDVAARLRDEEKRDYLEHKAEYRAKLEKSGLIGRFRRACDGTDTTLKLMDDYIEIIDPNGTTARIPYDRNCLPVFLKGVETIEATRRMVAASQPINTSPYTPFVTGGNRPS